MPSRLQITSHQTHHSKHYNVQRGMTLVEIMVVMAILALLALFAAPEFSNWRPKLNLKSQSEEIFSNMQSAKTHALKNNVDVIFTFNTSSPCPGGDYSFDELLSGTTVSSGTMTEGVCLSSSDFVAGDGCTSRGLPINGAARTLSLTHSDVSGVRYDIQLSVAGGVSIDKI